MRTSALHPLALYIHWPFCVSKCPYCDFNSHVRETIDQTDWREALLADLQHEAGLLQGCTLQSIFFGGGTPSLMPPETVAQLIDSATSYWPVADNLEITLEANPSSVETERFADLARAGVNRLSLGVQSLDETALALLGRAHSTDEALAALEIAQDRFDRVSLDLIYALPGQSIAAWEDELARAIGFGTEHMSLYQLTIEPGTRFETLVRTGELATVDPDHGADLFEMTQAMTGAAGLSAYEVSNHARPGAESRHNLAYWRYRTYAGIGPGAHGRRAGLATVRHRKPENWLAAVRRNGHGLSEETPLTPAETAREALVMGLRLREGVDLGRIATETGIARLVNEVAINRLGRQGLIHRAGGTLTVTPGGMLLLDGILREIVEV